MIVRQNRVYVVDFTVWYISLHSKSSVGDMSEHGQQVRLDGGCMFHTADHEVSNNGIKGGGDDQELWVRYNIHSHCGEVYSGRSSLSLG